MIVDIVLICKLIYNEISFQEDYPRDQLKKVLLWIINPNSKPGEYLVKSNEFL